MTNKIKLPVSEIEPGMYIALLDRPWMETPFPLQGFIASSDDIQELTQICQYVYVDPGKSEERHRNSFKNIEQSKAGEGSHT